MKANTIAVPVENWETEPELTVVSRNGAKAETNPVKVLPRPVVIRGVRPEFETLCWEARLGRLISLARSR